MIALVRSIAPGKGQWQAFDRVRRKRRQIGNLLDRYGELDIVEPLDDLLRRDLDFHPCKSGSDAAVYPRTEGKMSPGVAATDIQVTRAGEARLVGIGGREQNTELNVGWQDLAA